MALPVNIDDLVNHRKVEWARIEYKEGWNPEKVLHTLCAFANDIDNWGGGYVILGVAEKDGKPVFPVKGLPSDSIDRIQKELLGVCHFTFVLPVHKYFLQSDAKTVHELNGTDPVTLSDTVPVPYQYRTSTVPVPAPVRRLLLALKDGPRTPSELRAAIGIQHRQTFRENYLNPAIHADLIYAEEGLSPHNPRIHYTLTDKGKRVLRNDITVTNLQTEVIEKAAEVGMKIGISGYVERGNDHVNQISVDVSHDFEVLMGAYRSDFRENARKVLYVFTETPEADISSVAKRLGFSAKSVWRAIRAMKEVGLLVREGGDKGGKWIVKK